MNYHPFPVWVKFVSPYAEDGYYAVPVNVMLPGDDDELEYGYAIECVPDDFVFLGDRDDEAIRVMAVRLFKEDWTAMCHHEHDKDVAFDNETWLVLTDSEADDEWETRLDNFAVECVPGYESCYFDRERWMNDAKVDHRANRLAPHDGMEQWERVGGTCYYLYRQN